MKLTSYEEKALEELRLWQRQMMRKPTVINRWAAKMQLRMNRLIPEKVHSAITATIKQMVRAVLFGAEHTTSRPPDDASFEAREDIVQQQIIIYKRTAAAEGGITGAGGILFGLADFPLLLGIKLKLLFNIASACGYSVKDYRERLYILYIFQLAFSSAEKRKKVYLQLLNWENDFSSLPEDIHEFDWRSFQQEYRDYIDLAKIAQLIPVIGAPVGAVVNYRLIQKLGRTAMNAYRLRWWKQSTELVK